MSISVFSYWIDPNGGTTSDSIKADCIFHEDGSVETCLKSGVVSVRSLSSSITHFFIQENNCSSLLYHFRRTSLPTRGQLPATPASGRVNSLLRIASAHQM